MPKAKAKTRDEIIEAGLLAALHLAGNRPWAEITLSSVAIEAGLDLDVFHGVADLEALAEAVEPYFDKAMSAERADLEETDQERLFDAVMRRFEAMEPHRAGLLSLMAWRDRSPGRRLAHIAARQSTAKWALVSAGLDQSDEAPLAAKALNLSFAMARAERAWRKDAHGDFAQTMATLDKELRRAEERAARVRRWRGAPRRRTSRAGEAGPEAPQEATPQA